MYKIFLMFTNICFVLFTISTAILAADTLRNYYLDYRYNKQTKKEEHMEWYEGTEETDDVIKEASNVKEFRKRMETMKVEYYDGVPLYDSLEDIDKSSEAGVEIITPSQEMEIERRIKWRLK